MTLYIDEYSILSIGRSMQKNILLSLAKNYILKQNMATMASNAKVPMIDIGANLLDPMFRGIYREKQKHEDDFNIMLQRAFDVGVEKIIITSGNKEEAIKSIEFCKTVPTRLFTTVGVHPTRCTEFDTATNNNNNNNNNSNNNSEEEENTYLSELVDICKKGKESGSVVAIGEFGLDYERIQFCPIDVQKKYFDKQFILAKETELPLFLHNRNSSNDLIEILLKNKSKWEKGGGVVHSFDGTLEEMKAFVDMGLHIGINGCSLRTEENLKVVKEIPIDRLLIETDAPWCGIKNTHPGKKYVQTIFEEKKDKKFVLGKCVKNRCEPCHLIQVIEVLANVRGVENINKFGLKIKENTEKLFFPSI